MTQEEDTIADTSFGDLDEDMDETFFLELDKAIAAAEAGPPSPPPSRPIQQRYSKGWLSVTDFASLQWCEQQVYYSNTTVGYRPPQTEAMRAGQAIHKALEVEVGGEEVTVDIESKEDAWGLRYISWVIGCS
ncbi:hypothetical protein HK104_007006 [Borealophlyctis nickersoniae]|nr:hypothetical protein HK104_007006 [Borealophlyctis nickersoniae]